MTKDTLISVDNIDSNFQTFVRAETIVKLSKDYKERTIITLDSGEEIKSNDSMNTITARITNKLN